MNKNSKNIDFTPLQKREVKQVQMRPSQSYWQDAMRRFRKNKRAMAAALTLIIMMLICFIGPIFWKVDPNVQQLNEALQKPIH